ncbi:hypothetical protein NDU88_005223 [Pleurodeles waltl]|uniref:Uncharacterized protein n=1 Tax=Pleurodeles waltl TaxID=8319 RepID=A0AAV7WB93_PLEWA|nr:hypothetical protein NDU88_005223 [Pleurodeles waltl]
MRPLQGTDDKSANVPRCRPQSYQSSSLGHWGPPPTAPCVYVALSRPPPRSMHPVVGRAAEPPSSSDHLSRPPSHPHPHSPGGIPISTAYQALRDTRT